MRAWIRALLILLAAAPSRAPRSRTRGRRARTWRTRDTSPHPLASPTDGSSGPGLIAERIVAEARAAGVPVRADAALAEALGQLDLGREIPEALYHAVAEALAWAYRLDARAGRQGARP